MKVLIKSFLVAFTLMVLMYGKSFAQPTISYPNSPASISRSAAVGSAPNPTLNATTSGITTALGYNATATQPLNGGVFSSPSRGIVDAAGNIYVVNYGNGTISKFASNGTLITNNFTSGGPGLTNPADIAFDSSGNLWVLTQAASLQKFSSAGAWISTTAITVGGSTFGICIASNDDMFITSSNGSGGTDKIVKITAALVQSTLVTSTNLSDPSAIGISSANNLYVLNLTSGNISVYSASTGVSSAATFATGYANSYALNVDAANNYVYIATNAAAGTLRVYATTTANTATVITSISNVANAYGVFPDGKGNLYVPNFAGNVVNRYRPTGRVFIDKALPAGLAINNTNGNITGTATVSTPVTNYTVTAWNTTGSTSTTLKLNTFLNNVWDGSSSTAWATGANWSTNAVPGIYDMASIGTVAYANEPIITTPVTVGSIVFGTSDNTASTLTVTGTTLNVTGDITYQSDGNSSTNNAFVGLIQGTGTINAANLKMIANTGNAAAYSLKLNSSVNNFNISGDISLTTTYINLRANNATFTVTGGTVSTTDLITSNVTNSTSTLAMTGGTLNFTDPTALGGLSANGTNTISLSSGSTIGYTASGAQTVYTSTAVTGLPSGISYQNLSVSGSGIKTAASGNLNIAGNFTNTLANDASNYLDVNGATVQFNGGTQSLAGGSGNGTDFKNVTFTGTSASTKTLTSGKFNVIPTGILTIAGTSTTLAAGSALLTLESDANSSATIPAIPAGSSITGTVNVERYISGNQSYSRGYRLISSPVSVSNASLIWPNLTYISSKTYTTGTGGSTNGFDIAGNPTMYLYRENMAPDFSSFISGNSRGIKKINNAPLSNFDIDGDAGTFNIPAGNGLLLFFRGDKATTSNPTVITTIAKPTTFTASGYLNQGNVVVKNWFTPASSNLSYTPATPISVRGFNLVGNPYASSINWDSFNPLSTNLSNFIWVYNPTTKAYSTYEKGDLGIGTGTNGGNVANIIPSGQGFYVQATAASPSLTFTEANKVNTQVPSGIIMLAAAPPITDLKYLRIKITQDAENQDDALIFFKPGTSSDYTPGEDGDYLRGNNVVAISTRVNNRAALAINNMPLPAYKETVNLNVIVPANGTYQLSVPEAVGIPAQYDVWIKDWLKKDSVNIKTSPTYTFDAVVTDSTTFKRRFSIVISTDPGSAYYLTDFKGDKQGGAVALTWKTGNEGNTVQFTIQRSNDDGLTYTDLGSFKSNGSGSYSFTDNSPLFFSENLYRLKQTDNAGNIAYSGTVPIAFGVYGNVVKNLIKVYPNPSASVIKLIVAEVRDKNSKAEKYTDYTITITNSQGIAVKTINTPQPDTWESDVSKYAPGVYFIKVYNNNTKTLVGNSKFVKL